MTANDWISPGTIMADSGENNDPIAGVYVGSEDSLQDLNQSQDTLLERVTQPTYEA